MSESTYLSKATSQATKTFFIKVMGYVIAFGSQLAFARILGADNVGLYQICINLSMVVTMFSVIGMDEANIRFIGEHYETKRWDYIRAYFWYSLKIALILVCIMSSIIFIFREQIALSIFKEENLIQYLPFFSIVMILHTLLELLSGYSSAIQQASAYFFAQEFLNKLTRVVIFFLFVFLNQSVAGLLWGTLIGFATAIAYLLFRMYKQTPQLFQIQKEEVLFKRREYLKCSSMLSVVYFTNYLMMSVNSIIIGLYLGATDVGIYSNAQTLSWFIIFIYVSFNSIFVAMVPQLFFSKKMNELRDLYQNITRMVLVVSLPLVILISMHAEFILGIFGEEFKAGKTALIILLISQLINIAVGPNESLLAMTGNERFSMLNGVVVAVVNIALNILLIPIYGIVGSAIAGGVALAIVNILKVIQVKRQLGMVPYNRSIYKVGIIGIVSTVYIYGCQQFLSETFFSLIITTITLYIVIAFTYVCMQLNEEERLVFQTLKNKFSKAV